jgi:hypothetical protein
VSTRPDSADPFGTAELRTAVLATWAASPARFREDANAEESLSRGYVDRVLVELAANAVDAARAGGVPARIRISLQHNEIRLANTGAALTPAGVAALASLRASAKRDQRAAVGHFGVGFTAVLAVSDSPRVISASGGVQFSADRTAESVAALQVPALDAELAARQGVLPTLRLCWPVSDPDPLPEGYSTEVRLPLAEDADGRQLVAEWSKAAVDHVFWALPDLQAVDLGDRVIARRTAPGDRVELVTTTDGDGLSAEERLAGFTWVTAGGELPAELLADRPVEERGRSSWRISWLLADGEQIGPSDPIPLCAPTPTDELLSLPARLVGTFGVDDTRRHLTDDAVNAFLLDRAATCYVDLVATVSADLRWMLVPPNGFPAGDVDAGLRSAVLAAWQHAPVLLTATGEPVSPATAVTVRGIDEPTAVLLSDAIPGLLRPPGRSAAAEALRTLHIRELTISEAIDALASLQRPPEFWQQIYQRLSGSDPDSLAGLPVPLVDGRQVLGVRGTLLPDPDTAPLAARAATVVPSLRIVHPAAVHPLLERLGAEPADPDAVLNSVALRDEIARGAADLDDGEIDPADLTEASVTKVRQAAAGPAGTAALVLDLIAAGGRADPTVLGDLVLTDATGEPWPAAGLMMPDSPLRALISQDDLPTVNRLWVEHWSAAVLIAVGVRAGLLVIAPSDARAEDLLAGLDDWLEQLPGGSELDLDNLSAVTDLDLINDWPSFLPLLAADRTARTALLTPRSYTAWWLRRHVRIDGRAPIEYRSPAATELLGLYEPLSIGLDPLVAAAIGVLPDLATAIAVDPQGFLERFCDPARKISGSRVAGLTAGLVSGLGMGDRVNLPSTVRTLAGTAVDADQVVVPDGPWWAQVLPAGQLLAPGPEPLATAELFDVDLASDHWSVSVKSGADSGGSDAAEVVTGQQLRQLVASVVDALAIDGRSPELRLGPELTVRLGDGESVRVGWWPADGEAFWVDGTADAVADAVAWSAGRYPDRELARAAVHGEPDRVIVESAFDPPR